MGESDRYVDEVLRRENAKPAEMRREQALGKIEPIKVEPGKIGLGQGGGTWPGAGKKK